VDVEALFDGNTGVYDTYTWVGNSFAAPHVAGTAANYLETHPAATPAQVAAAVHAATTRGALSRHRLQLVQRARLRAAGGRTGEDDGRHAIVAGTALRKGDAITSPNGFYTLRTQSDGSVVMTRAVGRVTWAPGAKGSWLQLRADGNLVAYDFGKPVWSSGSGGNGASDLRRAGRRQPGGLPAHAQQGDVDEQDVGQAAAAAAHGGVEPPRRRQGARPWQRHVPAVAERALPRARAHRLRTAGRA
jgi:subtilisin family serine protease